MNGAIATLCDGNGGAFHLVWMVIMAKRLPDEREAIEGAGVAVATASGLLRDADLLASAGSYGSAVSLAVLGFEESVKARSLGAIAAAAGMGRRPGISDDTLRKIIYSGHRERHTVGFIQYVAAASPGAYGNLMLGMPISAEDTAMLAPGTCQCAYDVPFGISYAVTR
jgi:hypothetical protein